MWDVWFGRDANYFNIKSTPNDSYSSIDSFYIYIFSCIEHERKLDTRQPWGITVIVAPECSKNAIFADFGL